MRVFFILEEQQQRNNESQDSSARGGCGGESGTECQVSAFSRFLVLLRLLTDGTNKSWNPGLTERHLPISLA